MKRGSPRICECGDHAFERTSAWGTALVSPANVGLLERFDWSLWNQYPGCAYAVRKDRARTPHKTVALHQMIMAAPMIDHRNGNGLDNRDKNLREANHSINSQNTRSRKGTKTGFRGVYRTVSGRYFVRAYCRGKLFRRGLFDDVETARIASIELRKELYGDAYRSEGV